MGKKEYIDQLQAYSLGCLNKDDFTSFRNFIYSGEQYPWQELGEYQNLAALLPSVLAVEVPDSQLKDKVARKLYRIKDEVRTKRTGERNIAGSSIDSKEEPRLIPDESQSIIEKDAKVVDTEPEKEQPPLKIEEASDEDNIISRIPEFEIVTPNRKSSESFKAEPEAAAEDKLQPVDLHHPDAEFIKEVHSEAEKKNNFYKEAAPVFNEHEEMKNSTFRENKTYNEDIPISAKSSIAVTALIILFLIVIAGGIYAYFSISSEVKTYKTEVERLNEELQSLSTKTDDSKELQKMLEGRDTRIVNLISQGNSGYGKLIFNLNQGKGYLQLGGMPSLPQGKAFQLWFNTEGRRFISLGVFSNSGAVEYYPVDLPELTAASDMRVIVTEESAGGADTPGRNIYLSGTL